MKKPDLQKLVPVGIDFRWDELPILALVLAAAALWSLRTPWSYLRELNTLKQAEAYAFAQPHSLYMVPFSQLRDAGNDLFGLYFLMLPLLGLTHLNFHRRRSMSVYLMKRLPNRWEYPIRCWAVPALGLLAGLFVYGVLFGLYYYCYRTFTPAVFLR